MDAPPPAFIKTQYNMRASALHEGEIRWLWRKCTIGERDREAHRSCRADRLPNAGDVAELSPTEIARRCAPRQDLDGALVGRNAILTSCSSRINFSKAAGLPPCRAGSGIAMNAHCEEAE